MSDLSPQEVQVIVQRALKEGPFAMRQLAQASGLSYAALRAWSAGDRIPQPESLRQLALGLKARAAKLQELAEQLERTAGEASES
jgi:transcriptional regulator with XRE-family HTH domain